MYNCKKKKVKKNDYIFIHTKGFKKNVYILYRIHPILCVCVCVCVCMLHPTAYHNSELVFEVNQTP